MVTLVDCTIGPVDVLENFSSTDVFLVGPVDVLEVLVAVDMGPVDVENLDVLVSDFT